MVKKILIISFLLLVPFCIEAAIGSTCVWEIRTTGASTGGGGYTSGGTDYSQQDAAQLNNTDFATSGIGVTTLTSTTGGFTSAMIGNIVHLTAGTNLTVGWYEITAYTDTNTVTLDRVPDDGVGGVSSATGYVGGALSLLEDFAWDGNDVEDGHTIYLKAGTYTSTASKDIRSIDGTTTLPITIEGYNASRGDNPTGTDRPLFALGAYYILFGDYHISRNIRITTTASYSYYGGAYNVMENMKGTNTSATADRPGMSCTGAASIVLGYEGESTNGFAIDISQSKIVGSYLHDSSVGINASAKSYCVFVSNIIDTNTTGINLTSGYTNFIINNTIYNNTTGISGTTAYSNFFINNILDNNTTGASWTTATPSNWWDYNAWDNTSDTSNVTKGDNAVTADCAMTDPANGDFTLGSGSSCLDVGLQVGTNQGATGDYKWNIGVDQDDVIAAGAGAGKKGSWIIF